ncbi:LemA family protein [Neisseria sicca ATCC 29256]|jgi:LemA family protein|uniref:LemA family protein n=1 Tax=Neisseria sicca ATCC 29256 TaxID=547045 RepID=C6MAQ4_NEISI|nr:MULTISPECIES: LemA family protein [Neisseria]EET42615.1 LemA family protein [Neisseria sicca ATCC 29256]OFN30622.1 LemA family protein [Neisseria sp. HMSC077D05]OHR74469.1 LemA family protein [Neisseria sp. HMSC70E02]
MFWLLVILIVIVLWLVKVYNKLQSSMQNIREGFSNLQAGLKKRQQLSGQIIEIASGYLEHEQVTQLRVAQSQNTQQLAAMAQNFPQLKADATYQKLMGQLEALENDILARRENYNNRVKRFNSYRNSFPAVLVAQKLSFDTVEYFDSDDEKFDAQVQSFARDDSAVLQEIIGNSAKAVKNISTQAVQVVQGNKKQLGNQTNDVTQPTNSTDNPADTSSEKPE